MGYYKYVGSLYKGIRKKIKSEKNKDLRELVTSRKKEWRKGSPIVRLERPTRIDKARKYGYKAKQGFVTARVRIRTGGSRKSRPRAGRKPARIASTKMTRTKSIQRIAEERAQKKFVNLEILGSYWLWEDGQYKWYEVVMVDPNHPVIQKDKDVNWICAGQHRNRALKGLTSAAKKGRGLRNKGKGAEKVRPSKKAVFNKKK
jgi:large subunit ribosomal protein L15e